jgi:uncharacterized protein YjbJ (UPF0337 family)
MEGETMGDAKADEAKGRLKEAGGALTGDDSLKREGKVDQASATAKKKVDQLSEKIKDTLRDDD